MGLGERASNLSMTLVILTKRVSLKVLQCTTWAAVLGSSGDMDALLSFRKMVLDFSKVKPKKFCLGDSGLACSLLKF